MPPSSSPTPPGLRPLCSAPRTAGHQQKTLQEGQSHWGSPMSPPQGAEELLDHPVLGGGRSYGQISRGDFQGCRPQARKHHVSHCPGRGGCSREEKKPQGLKKENHLHLGTLCTPLQTFSSGHVSRLLPFSKKNPRAGTQPPSFQRQVRHPVPESRAKTTKL